MWADPDADYDKIGKQQAELEDKIAAADAWSLERNVDIAMDALRCPPDDADVTVLSGGERRRVALCRLLLSGPTCCCSTSRPTTSTPSRSTGWSVSCRTTPAPSSRSPTTATSSTTSPSGSSNSTAAAASRSRATTQSGSSRSRTGSNARSVERGPASARSQRELEWVRMAPKARQAKGKARLAAYEKLHAEAEGAEPDRRSWRSRSRRAAPRRHVIEVENLRKGFGDRLLIEDLSFSLPPAGIVGIIGPNGAGKTTLFKMLAGREEPDAGSIKIGDTVDLATSTRTATTSTPTRRSTTRSPAASSTSRSAAARSTAGPTCRASTSRAPTTASASATCPAASATASTSPSCSSPAATCCCSTSRPTTSTSTRCGRSSPGSSRSPAVPW